MLTVLASALLVWLAPLSQGRADEPRPVTLAAEPFPLTDVRLLPGSPFAHSQEMMGRYLLQEDTDRLLHNFRIQAGLPSNAKPLGGWEDPGCELRGHYAGHFLSALALMYQSTGDERYKQRAVAMVKALAECQQKMGTGYLSAYPESMIDRVMRAERVWAPWYTLHKVAAGLLDVHMLCADPTALEVAKRFASWCKAKTDTLSDEQFQKMLGTEFGGMPEFFANLYSVTHDPDHLAMAKRFTHHVVMDPLAAGQDRLRGLHVNTQVPKALGAARLYELTGDEPSRSASANFWEMVTQHRTYATGGASNYEYFRTDPDVLSTALSSNDHENCVTHNLLRLTRSIFERRPDAAVMDYYEKALLNGIMGTHHPEDASAVMYYVPMRSGLFRFFCAREDSYVCCSGTGIESFSKLGDTIYFHHGHELYVNLFIPSELNWKDEGVTIKQETSFPDSFSTKLTVSSPKPASFTLKLRVPGWTAGEPDIRVNGVRLMPPPAPGRYVDIAREWHSGDVVSASFPASLRFVPMPDRPERTAIAYGPVVLAGKLGTAQMDDACIRGMGGESWRICHEGPALPAPTLVIDRSQPISGWLAPVEGAPLTFRTQGVGKPLDVTLVPFFRLTGERYAVYWDTVTPEAWTKSTSGREALPPGVIDRVVVSRAAGEEDHNFQAWHQERGESDGHAWVRTDQWIRWDLAVDPDKPVAVNVAVMPEPGSYELAVDGIAVTTVRVEPSQTDHGVRVDKVAIPVQMTRGRSRITVAIRVGPEKKDVALGETTQQRRPETRRTPSILSIETISAE